MSRLGVFEGLASYFSTSTQVIHYVDPPFELPSEMNAAPAQLARLDRPTGFNNMPVFKVPKMGIFTQTFVSESSKLNDNNQRERSALDQEESGEPVDEIGEAGFHISWDPFAFTMRAIRIPLLGAIDIMATLSRPVSSLVVSLIYTGIPFVNKMFMSRIADIRETRIWPPRSVDMALGKAFSLGVLETDQEPISEPLIFAGTMELPEYVYTLWPRLQKCIHAPNAINNSYGFFGEMWPTADTLGRIWPEDTWRKEQRPYSLRCTQCWPNEHHHLSPVLQEIIAEDEVSELYEAVFLANPTQFLRYLDVIGYIKCQVRVYFDLKPEEFVPFLITISTSRVDSALWAHDDEPLILLTDSPLNVGELKVKFSNRKGVWDDEKKLILVIPHINSEASYGNLRILVSLLLPAARRVHWINQRQTGLEVKSSKELRKLNYSFAICSVGSVNPSYAGNLTWEQGKVRANLTTVVTLLAIFGTIYGFDENFLLNRSIMTIVIDVYTGSVPVLAPVVPEICNWLPSYAKVNFLVLYSETGHRRTFTAKFNRKSIHYLKQIINATGVAETLTAWHAFADPRPITMVSEMAEHVKIFDSVDAYLDSEPLSARYATGSNIAQELSAQIGPIIFFTFGSTGDNLPLEGIAQWLLNIGVQAVVVRLVTSAEGEYLATFDSAVDIAKTQLYLRARLDIVRVTSGVRVVPFSFIDCGHLTYSLAPPDDVIRPFVASTSAVTTILYNLLGSVFKPDGHIGAYNRPKTMPRSMLNRQFLKSVPNSGAPDSIAAYWGSGGVAPRGYETIPLVEGTDHLLEFSKYQTIMTLGAGAVQTASCAGATVSVVSSGLDREYWRPFDAGLGVDPNIDPDAILRFLGAYDSAFVGLWWRSNWITPWKYLYWLGPADMFIFVFRLLMLYFLYTRSQKAVILSTEPLVTVFLVVTNLRLNLKQFIALYVAAKVAEKALTVMDKGYYWMAVHFIRLNKSLMINPLGFWIAQRYNLLTAFVAVELLRHAQPFVHVPVTWTLQLVHDWSTNRIFDRFKDLVFLEYSLRLYSGVPVFHVALICPSKKLRYEGWRDTSGLYSFQWREGSAESSFIFPTSLDFNSISDLPIIYAPYSVGWNCHTGLQHMLRHRIVEQGIFSMASLFISACCAVAGFALGSTLAGGLCMILLMPVNIGGVKIRSLRVTLAASLVTDLATALTSRTESWMTTINAWVRGVMTAFQPGCDDFYDRFECDMKTLYDKKLAGSHIDESHVRFLLADYQQMGIPQFSIDLWKIQLTL